MPLINAIAKHITRIIPETPLSLKAVHCSLKPLLAMAETDNRSTLDADEGEDGIGSLCHHNVMTFNVDLAMTVLFFSRPHKLAFIGDVTELLLNMDENTLSS